MRKNIKKANIDIIDTIGSIDDLIEKYEENISKLLYIGDLEIKKIYDNKSYHLSKLLDCLSILKDGTHNPPKRVKIGIPLLTGQNIDNGFINHKDITYVSLEDYNKIHSKYAPSIGDLVITKIGTVGKVAVLRKQDIPITIHCNSALLRFKTIHYSTAFFVLNSKDFQNEFHTHKNQTVQEFINLEQLGNLNVKIPECDESIFDNIFCSISKYKDIIDKLNQLKQLYLKKFFG